MHNTYIYKPFIIELYMSREEQKRISDLATKALKQDRSREEILETLQSAGIVDKDGKIMEPYTEVLEQI